MNFSIIAKVFRIRLSPREQLMPSAHNKKIFYFIEKSFNCRF